MLEVNLAGNQNIATSIKLFPMHVAIFWTIQNQSLAQKTNTAMKGSTQKELSNFIKASSYALEGLPHLFKENAAKRELILIIISIILFIHEPTGSSLQLVVIAIIILGLESLNTAIEEICDLISIDFNHKIKKTKDLGASSILICLTAWTISLIFHLTI